MYSRALKSWHVYGPLILRSIVDFLQTWIFVTNSSPIIWCYCDENFELTIFQATNTCIWRIITYFEYMKFISIDCSLRYIWFYFLLFIHHVIRAVYRPKCKISLGRFARQKHKTFEQISTSNGICIFSNFATGRTWSSIWNGI